MAAALHKVKVEFEWKIGMALASYIFFLNAGKDFTLNKTNKTYIVE